MSFDYEKNEVSKARTICRASNVQKWFEESAVKLTATPFQLHVEGTLGFLFQEKPAAEVESAPGKPGTVRIVSYTTTRL